MRKDALSLGILLATIISAVIIYLPYSIIGNVVIEDEGDDGCITLEYEYNGSILEIANPKNNSYINTDDFTFVINTDYWGTDIVTKCEDEDDEFCSPSVTMKVRENFGSKSVVQVDFSNISNSSVGNQTIKFDANCSLKECEENEYALEVVAGYSCSSEEFDKVSIIFNVDKTFPNITDTYPYNNQIINISSNSSITIVPTMNASDSVGIKTKQVAYGSNKINITNEENVTLIPGNYTWNFEAIDMANNKKTEEVKFRVVNDTSELPVVHNATISFTGNTPENNKIINTTSFEFKIVASSDENIKNITFNILNNDNGIVYTASTNNSTLNTSYLFQVDGTYKYIATVFTDSLNRSTESRTITIDTKKPTITIVSPKEKDEVFIEKVLIEFSATDENGISGTWINNGSRDIDYLSASNFTLDNGNYIWTLYAQDNAGNIKSESIEFEIKNKSKLVLIIIIASVVVLLIVAVVSLYVFLVKKKSGYSKANNSSNQVIYPSQQFPGSQNQFSVPMPNYPYPAQGMQNNNWQQNNNQFGGFR